MTENLIDKYGRFKVHQVVASFYDRVLSSPRLQTYFDGIDIQGLVDHQAAFLRGVMGGPAAHSPDQIQRSHHHLNITEDDFDEMIRLLVESLEKHQIEPDDVETVRQRYYGYQTAVIAGGS